MTFTDMDYRGSDVDHLIEWANTQRECKEQALDLARSLLDDLGGGEPITDEELDVGWQILTQIEEIGSDEGPSEYTEY